MSKPWVVLFDGKCAFCRSQAERIARLCKPNDVVVRDFQDRNVLAEYPTLTHADCMKAMRLVAPSGRIFSGAEAVARLMLTKVWLAPFGLLYFLPGASRLAELLYAWVARRRYALAKTSRKVVCDGDVCRLHFE